MNLRAKNKASPQFYMKWNNQNNYWKNICLEKKSNIFVIPGFRAHLFPIKSQVRAGTVPFFMAAVALEATLKMAVPSLEYRDFPKNLFFVWLDTVEYPFGR